MIPKIKEKILSTFEVEHLEVVDESSQHHVPKGSLTHLKVVIVSKQFENIKLLKRHQSLYALLKEEMQLLHALSFHLFTPDEWKPTESPKCLGRK